MLKRKNREIEYLDSNAYNRDKSRKLKLKKYQFKNFAFKWGGIYLIYNFMPNLLGIILCVVYGIIYTMFCDHRDILPFSPTIRIWFGVPGAGKTSMAAVLTKHSNKFGYRVLSNVQIKGSYKLDVSDLGQYDMSFGGDGAHVILDEGSLEFDNRLHKEFANTNKPKYFALHRHMNNRVDVFSQGYDIDKRIRDRAASSGLFHLKRFPVPGFVMYRKIDKVLFIRKEDRQMIDGFKFRGLPRIMYSRDVWKSFDTLDTSLCPKLQKEWKLW